MLLKSILTPTVLIATILTSIFVVGMDPARASSNDGHQSKEGSATRTILLTPELLRDETGRVMEGERGLIFVPENRSNPDSRLIAVHFQRYRAVNPPAGEDKRAPIFLLAGGPGGEFTFRREMRYTQLDRLRQTRDVVVMSQRGNPRAPGLVPDFRIRSEDTLPLDKPASIKTLSEHLRKAYTQSLAQWTDLGVDVQGYDIINIVDDVDDVRKALGYGKLVLHGCSFGSHSSFSYLTRWPQNVDRALLGGVEPLDFGYDSAKWLWASMERLAAQAEADPDLAPSIPEGGLLKALTEVIKDLDREPRRVVIEHPETGEPTEVVVGADDLRAGSVRAYSELSQGNHHDRMALWPHFVLDMVDGDFRALALMALESRQSKDQGILIGLLLDNSLGISSKRDRKLKNERARRWIDPNWYYRATRTVDNTPLVDRDFIKDQPISVPVLMVSGDLDWYTPIENAEHIEPFLKTGKLVTVAGATHCPLYHPEQMPLQDPDTVEQIYGFLDADFSEKTAADYLAALPSRVVLQPIDFAPADSINVYELMISSQ